MPFLRGRAQIIYEILLSEVTYNALIQRILNDSKQDNVEG